nr:uncharacterized protein CI109_004247 [Kwoniella shandongensis]KAA5527431.1 hypothetical protein CI109_004247 [Kwoniella shandongensis]
MSASHDVAPPPYEASASQPPAPLAASTTATTPSPHYFPERSQTQLSTLSINDNESSSAFTSTGPGLAARSSWSSTGDVDVWIDLKATLPDLGVDYAPSVKEYAVDTNPEGEIPILNIVMFVIGNGDEIQLYITLALELIIRHSHRVRIATQEIHKGAIERARVQSLSGKVGKDGQPLEDKLHIHDIYAPPGSSLAEWRKQPEILEPIFRSFYKSTYWQDQDSGTPFAADLIIAAPSCLAHIHTAELLGLPLHIVAGTPWSPTTAFSHPCTAVHSSNAEQHLTSYLSYALFENLVWKSLGNAISDFRSRTLGLPPSDDIIGPGLLDRLKIPFTYTWSSLTVTTPADWKQHIDVTGFLSRDEGSYRPDDELLLFLKEGSPPIYVKLDLPDRFDSGEEIFGAIVGGLRKMGSRVIVSGKGAGSFRGTPEIFVIAEGGEPPLEYLLAETRVAAICHDGGAHVSSTALRYGVPSILIRTNCLNSFWGDRLVELGVASRPIPIDLVSIEQISSVLDEVYSPSVREAARSISNHLRSENGGEEAVKSIHRHLPLQNMRCDIVPSQVALWYHPEYSLRLSGVAAAVLSEAGKVDFQGLELNRPREFPVSLADSDPIVGGVQAFFVALTKSVTSVTHMFSNPAPQRVVDIPSQQPTRVSQVHNSKGGWTWNYERGTRERMPITDMKSGMREAGQEAWTGVKDGMRGVVMEPWRGLQRAGPIGGAVGIIHGTVGLVGHSLSGGVRALTAGLEGAASEARNRSNSTTPSERTTVFQASSPADVLRSSRAKISQESLKQLGVTEGDKARILAEWKVQKSPEKVEARRMRQRLMVQGESSGPNGGSGAVVLGQNQKFTAMSVGSSATSSATGGSTSGSGKWWKGKGKGKGKERADSGASTPSYRGESGVSAKEQEVESERNKATKYDGGQ